ncbi:MAG: helix-hairpin-helix domain-containing protein [Bacteroidales bacterium]|nr:helix-hairpin-helix domain-containing protein [Bacteroidales bacterium]
MANKSFKSEHKTGITALVCILLGIAIAFAYMYSTGNRVIVLQDAKSADNISTDKTKYKSDSRKNNQPNKRYNIFNYYYSKNSDRVYTESLKTDTLPSFDRKGFYKAVKTNDESFILDLNNCDTLDLQLIRGIGPVFARRIIKYGELLGGYVSVEQLKEVYAMDSSRYEGLKNHLVIGNNNIKKLKINSASVKELAKHPYIDNYLAKEIIVFRNNYGNFTDINQIKAVHLMDDSVFNKIKPYISLE